MKSTKLITSLHHRETYRNQTGKNADLYFILVHGFNQIINICFAKILHFKAALTSFELGMDDFRTVQKPALKL